MTRWLAPLWALALLLSALSARAQAPAPAAELDRERAKESFQIGAAAYAAGEYLAAIAALESAYAAAPLPAIAFSLAQAERRQYFVDQGPEHLRRSIALFRRYLEQTPSGGRRADAIEALAQLEPLAERLDAAPPAPGANPEAGTRLLVIAEAPGAQISVDGQPVTGTLIRDIAPGRHRVHVRAPGFRDAEREVMAVAGELIPVSMPLTPLPGVLVVSAPEDAEIHVDGAFASLGGARVELELPSGSHRITVAQNGYRVASRQIEVPRGGRESVSFTLEPTVQRTTSRLLLIGSGAALAGSAFLGVLALESEAAAREFLDEREGRNMTPAELVRYEADVARRDRYRLIAGAGVAASIGLLVTGLFLHELDQPRAEELNRAEVDLAADIGPHQLGIRLQGAF